MAAAAVLAWLIAERVHAPQSFIAPYTAVFLMTETVYRSATEALRQVSSVVLGVLLAFVVISFVPNTAVALAVAVFVGMLIGVWRGFGDNGIWVGVTALLMLTYGTANDPGYLVYRVVEGLIGAGAGLAVEFFVLPPVRLREPRHAVRSVSAELSALLERMSAGLREGWQREDAERWRWLARDAEAGIRDAEATAAKARESTKLNPRWRLLRTRRRAEPPRTYEVSLRALREVTKQLQHITDTLVSAADPDSTAPRPDPAADRSLAGLLDALATVIAGYRDAPQRGPENLDAVRAQLDAARRGPSMLGEYEAEPAEDRAVPAALLLSLERALRALIDEHPSNP